MKIRKQFDTRDLITIALILLAIAVVLWAGLRATVCIDAMAIYNEGGEWMCRFCDTLIDGGILKRG